VTGAYQPVPRCFFCDAWLADDDAFLTRHGKVFGECCADAAAAAAHPAQ